MDNMSGRFQNHYYSDFLTCLSKIFWKIVKWKLIFSSFCVHERIIKKNEFRNKWLTSAWVVATKVKDCFTDLQVSKSLLFESFSLFKLKFFKSYATQKYWLSQVKWKRKKKNENVRKSRIMFAWVIEAEISNFNKLKTVTYLFIRIWTK